MTTKTDDIKLPELPVGFFKHHIAGFDGPVYAEMQMEAYARAAVEADRQHNDMTLAHKWIRPALNLPDNAPYRFDFYAQKIGELVADRQGRMLSDAELIAIGASVGLGESLSVAFARALPAYSSGQPDDQMFRDLEARVQSLDVECARLEAENDGLKNAQPAAPSGLGFRIEERAGIRVLAQDGRWCRPASETECALWDALMSGQPAASAEPAVWVASDTLNSPHPKCISSLAYMSQIDQDRGREYVPLAIINHHATPVAAQAQLSGNAGELDGVQNPNRGHGWVHPRPDGVRARCGGPEICSICALEAARAAKEKA